MSDSTWWWLLAGTAVAVELLTGTFFLLMLAIGLAAAALAAQAGAGMTLQLGLAAAVGGGAVLALSRWRRRHPREPEAAANRNINLDIGQTVRIAHWSADGTAHVRYRGADWTATLSTPTETPKAGSHRIVAVRGSQLIVQAVSSPSSGAL